MRTWKVMLGLVLVVLVAYGIFSVGFLSHGDVCTTCGLESHALSLYGVTLSRGTRSTPVNDVLTGHGVVVGHGHRWLLEHGSGLAPLGPMCVLGHGRHVGATVRNKQVARFLDELIKHEGAPAARAYWLSALAPATADKWLSLFIATDFDRIDWSDPQAFREWWRQWGPTVEERILR